MADTYNDTLGDFAVTGPRRPTLRVVVGAMIALAAVGFYLGLNTADHTTRLPGDTRGSNAATGPDFSGAKVAVALAPIAEPPPPPAPEPVETVAEAPVAAAPTVITPVAPVVEAPPPAAAPAPTPPPPSLEGLF